MLRLLFWFLIAANGAFLAFRMGYLDTILLAKSEPLRIANQLNADKIKLIPVSKPSTPPTVATASAPSSAKASAPTATSAAASAPDKPKKLIACTEVGDFTASDTKKFEARLTEMALGDRQTRRTIQDVATHMVFIPPQGSKEGADKKAGELKRMGVSNFFIVQDNSKLRWGISLGVFKTEAAAKKYLISLGKQGVRSAKVGARSVSNTRVAYVLRDLDANNLKALGKIMTDFPAQKSRECGKG
jgi:hypothetical protein